MVCLNKSNKLTIAGGIKPIHNSYTSHHSTGGGCSKLPNLTKLAKGAVTSLIIFSTIISICTPILVNLTGVSATTIDSTTSTNTSSSNPSSQSSQSSPSDPNYLTNALEANGIDTSTLNTNTNEVDPTTMASDLASLNNALAIQATNEGISISLTNSNNQPITTTNPATIDIDPSNATGSGVTTNSILSATSITANVKTAMPGYTLSISTNTDNSNLTNTDSTLANTQNGSNILPTTGTQESPVQLTTNTWGYAMKRDSNNQYTTKFDTTYTTGNTNSLTSKWAKVPTNQAPQTIKHTEDTPQAAGDNTTVYYAANVPKNKTAGQYQTTITYTVTANVLAKPEVEKVSPDTIKQSLQMTIGETEAVGTPGSSNYQPAQTFACYVTTCYVTTAGSVYCAGPAENSGPAYNQILNRANWMRYVTPNYTYTDNYKEVIGGSFTPVQAQKVTNAGEDGNDYTTYWFKIDTSKFDGGVAQMVVGGYSASGTTSSDRVSAGAFTCYLTTTGSVYCAGPAGNSTGVQYDQILNRPSWIRYVTPNYTYTDNYKEVRIRYVTPNYTYTDNYKEVIGGSFTPVQAQKVNNAGEDGNDYTTYWFKIDTIGMGSSSTTSGTTITLTGKNLSKVTNVYIDTNIT